MTISRNSLLFCFVLLAFSALEAQQLKFRLVGTDSIAAANVKVVNLVTEQTAVSNASGEFSIAAKPDQLLVFPSENYEYKRYLIKDKDVFAKRITIVLIPKPVELDEVVVLKDINPETLGLVPKGQKQYTPAERKLETATSGPVDIIANAISGRTKMLKKQVKVEKKEALFDKLRYQFSDSLYITRLKIPADYVKGFQYYCIDDQQVVKALNAKNKPSLLQRISQLAPTYVELIAIEEKQDQP